MEGTSTDSYINYFVNIIKLLRLHGVDQVLVVFDGLPLPSKSCTNLRRSEMRNSNILLAKEAEAMGDLKLATSYYQQSVSISPDMVHQLIQTLDAHGVHYMVAPFESDAQLAYLSLMNIIDVVITEDSDSIVYGCHSVFFKIDREGNGDLLERKKLADNQSMSFCNWTDDQFKLFCCMAGCDYMPKIPSVGIKTAYKIVSKHRTLNKAIDQLILQISNKKKKLSSSTTGMISREELALSLERCLMTFKHQTVYDPVSEGLCPLTPIPPTSALRHPDLSFLGVIPDHHQHPHHHHHSSIVSALVAGKLNLQTMTLFLPSSNSNPSSIVTTTSSSSCSSSSSSHDSVRLSISEGENTEGRRCVDETMLWGFLHAADADDADGPQKNMDRGHNVTWMMPTVPSDHLRSAAERSSSSLPSSLGRAIHPARSSCSMMAMMGFSSDLVCSNLPLIRRRFPVVDTNRNSTIMGSRMNVSSTYLSMNRLENSCSYGDDDDDDDDDTHDHRGVGGEDDQCSRDNLPAVKCDSSFIDDDGVHDDGGWILPLEGEPPVIIPVAAARYHRHHHDRHQHHHSEEGSSSSYSHACQVAHTAMLLLQSIETTHHRSAAVELTD